MNADQMAREIIEEIKERGGFMNSHDAYLTLTRILSTKLSQMDPRAAGVKQERAECVELLNQARKLYERYFNESADKEREIKQLKHYQEHGQANLSQALILFEPFVSSHEWFAKVTAIEYAILVIEKWRDCPNYKPGHLPLPF